MINNQADLKIFRIGTRGSPLALTQANMLKSAIQAKHPDLVIEIIPIKSAADWKKQDGERPLSEQDGGKGQFAKEVEEALLSGAIDCGVHSLKDMAAFLPDGLEITHVLPRADARDAFISDKYKSIAELPIGAVVGTCSVRRQALLLAERNDLKIVPFRGNVQTRLDKVSAGQVDATFLAMAGVTRLAIESYMIHPIEIDDMLPACGQGVVCMETRIGDTRAQDILDAVHCFDTGLRAAAEREILKILDGSCHTPIGAFANIKNDILSLQAVVSSLDGVQIYKEDLAQECSSLEGAISIGQTVANILKAKVPPEILI